MMIRGSSSKEAGDSQNHDEKKKSSSNIGSKSSCSSSSSSWHRLKDPRIVRVSRAFGGKDRHSKVCTVRGLRDRRVRLSVPTAIQLYDLQDRLGVSQPSKVVDWLLNAAKDEIDELPPLQMPPLGFPTTHSIIHQQPTLHDEQQSSSNKEQLPVEAAVPASLYQWDPNSFPLSYMGFMMSQSQDARHANTTMQPPSTLSLSSGSHPDNYFPSLENNNDPRLQMQLLNHHMRPNFQLTKDQQHHFPHSK